MKTFISHSVNETEEFAAQLAQTLRPGDVLAFRGGMGAGKTAFIRGLARGLEVTGEVSSPTFALVHEHNGKIPLFHFDLYRITSLEDLYSTGYFDYLDRSGILAVEWSEQIEGILDEKTILITRETLGETSRKITVEGDERF